MEWKSIIILCVAVQTVFASIDLFLLRRYKSSLHTHLVRFWVWLDDVHIREIYRVVAALFLKAKSVIFGDNILNGRMIMGLVYLSLAPTLVILSVGYYFDFPPYTKNKFGHVSDIPWLELITINLIFDYLTFIGTFFFIRIVRDKGAFSAFVAICADIAWANSLRLLLLHRTIVVGCNRRHSDHWRFWWFDSDGLCWHHPGSYYYYTGNYRISFNY